MRMQPVQCQASSRPTICSKGLGLRPFKPILTQFVSLLVRCRYVYCKLTNWLPIQPWIFTVRNVSRQRQISTWANSSIRQNRTTLSPLGDDQAATGKEPCGRSLGLYLPANDACAGNNPETCVWTHWIQQSMHWCSKALTMKDLKCGSTRILPFRTRAFQKHSYLRKSATDRIEARANCPRLFDVLTAPSRLLMKIFREPPRYLCFWRLGV